MHWLMICCVNLLCLPALASGQDPADEGFVPLFNGQDFSGWVRTNTPPDTWYYEDGLLVCTGKPIGEIRTEKMYQNFILELEWRHMVPGGNAGVFLFADDITARGVPFHRGIEVQVLENSYGNTRSYTTHGDIFPIHGAKMVPVNGRGGDRAFPTENRSLPSPQWNHYRITAQDGAVTLAVNGHVVTRGTQCSPRKGYLCLESEGGVVHYRNVRIKELPDTPIPDSEVATANRGYVSIYSGLDLRDWQLPPDAPTAAWQSRDWVLSHPGPDGSATPLTYEPALGDFGLVIDFKLNDPASLFSLELAAATSSSADNVATTTIFSTASLPAPVATQQWHRLEGIVRGQDCQWTLNGVALDAKVLPDLQTPRRLILAPTHAVDFANLYLQPLPPAEDQ